MGNFIEADEGILPTVAKCHAKRNWDPPPSKLEQKPARSVSDLFAATLFLCSNVIKKIGRLAHVCLMS